MLPAAESSPGFAPSVLLQAECQAEGLPPVLKAQPPPHTLQTATAAQAEERTIEGRITKLGAGASDCRVQTTKSSLSSTQITKHKIHFVNFSSLPITPSALFGLSEEVKIAQ